MGLLNLADFRMNSMAWRKSAITANDRPPPPLGGEGHRFASPFSGEAPKAAPEN
jgi:hypothetical protein